MLQTLFHNAPRASLSVSVRARGFLLSRDLLAASFQRSYKSLGLEISALRSKSPVPRAFRFELYRETDSLSILGRLDDGF